MNKNQKLELTWIGKDARPKLEPRILLEDPEKSFHSHHRRRRLREGKNSIYLFEDSDFGEIVV